MQTLLIVAKQPTAGQTKTRLCPPLMHADAAKLYEAFLQDALQIMRSVPHIHRQIAYLPATAEAYFGALAPDFALLPQQGNNLGERLDHLLTDALAAGAHAAVVMNSDSPTLPAAYLSQAFRILKDGCDVVLGPSDDGGYYLIGLTQPQPRLLRDVTMSTPNVLDDTLAIAAKLQLRVALLPSWYDVDTASELRRLRTELVEHKLAGTLQAHHTHAILSRFEPLLELVAE